MRPTVQTLIRIALIDFYKRQGFRGTELYRKIIIALNEHKERIANGLHNHNRPPRTRRS